MYKIKRGLSLPLSGAPIGDFENCTDLRSVAITGDDFYGMKPSMLVKEGDEVSIGQKLFECKKTPGVSFTAPVSGIVKKINRGYRRTFQTLEIEMKGEQKFFNFSHYKTNNDYSRTELISFLNEAGVWNSFRTRPYSKTPMLGSSCIAIFVTAIDTNPLSLNPDWVITQRESEFQEGLRTLTKLTDGNIYLCKKYGSNVSSVDHKRVQVKEFDGPHPAGNVGTHIHFVDPVDENKTVWHIGYQDLIALGSLVLTGKLYTDRFIAVGGPACSSPKIILTKQGADLKQLLSHYKKDNNTRVISGSVFNGRSVDDNFYFLGKFSNQVTMIEECIEREFMGWQNPGTDKFSIMNLFASKLIPNVKIKFNTSSNGSSRAIVPIGAFEKIMPLDILPTHLMKHLMVCDTESAMELGALELDEEDLALCTFVCNGKNDYGAALRKTLDIIEIEG